MMKKPLLYALFTIAFLPNILAQEVFSVDSINRTLTPAGSRYYLAHPYEIVYGRDDSLYITEKVGRVRTVSATTGLSRIILDHRASTFLNVTRNGAGVATDIKQNGMMGMALHKDFKAPSSPVNYVYIAYSYNANNLRISRFTYNTANGTLGSELQLVNGIPASTDHSSGRLVYGADDKLYYSCGDQGANQFSLVCNPIRSQQLPTQAEFTANNYQKYQGKILRVNLDGTVPADNPLLDPDGAGAEVAVRSHIYTWGHRNPQGLVFEMNDNDGSTYPTMKTGGIFYSSEHGIRTDDELNIISSGANYGWPLWAGFRNSPAENYRYINWSTSGSCGSTGYNEVVIPSGATVIQENASPAGSFTDPIFSMYPGCNGAPNCNVSLTTGTNWMQYPTIAPSSIDHYGFSNIPGWKGSLIVPTLRRGTVYRYKLNAAGNGVVGDSVNYFFRTDRYRDLAIKNGNIIFTITDSTGSTSGPSGGGTSGLTRPGTILKYTFLGYQHVSGTSSISNTIGIAAGLPDQCVTASSVTINAANNNIWVPITGPDGNILAEIKANGNNLGVVTASYYRHTGASVRSSNGRRYLNRNIRITVASQPAVGNPASVRLYITNAEFTALDNDGASGINVIGDLRILKNNDACGSTVSSLTTAFTPTVYTHGSFGYALQADIPSFSSFYFGSNNITLPLNLLTFDGSLHNNTTLLKWETSNETNVSHFAVERSIDGRNFTEIGTVAANGNTTANTLYSYTDNDVANQPTSTVHYRLKMIDIDGASTYSKVIVIALANITSINVSPNPASDKVRLAFVSAGETIGQWSIMDNSGRIVLQSSTQVRKGNNNVLINIEKLSAGIYYLKLTGDGIDQKVKLQKL
jgi:PQQ-dependent dehydrogenase (s-GDH family)